MNFNTSYDYPIILLAFLVGVTTHEFGHAAMAVYLGDDTPRRQGRLTLNPIDHLDPIGTIFIAVTAFLGYGLFGWGKPVLVNTANLKSPRWSMLWVALAGPIMSLLTALACGLICRFGLFHMQANGMWQDILTRALDVNLVMFLFNLIPVPPLDGSKILSALLPIDAARAFDKLISSAGMVLFIFAIILGNFFVGPILPRIALFILGPHFTMPQAPPPS